MNNKQIGVLVMIVVVVLVILYFVPAPKPPAKLVPPEGDIVINGTVVCLPHKDTSGPQTLECAFGLKDEGGRYYALRDTDPNYGNVTGAPMNVPVMVTGTFTPQPSEIYQDIGVIDVTSILLANASTSPELQLQ